MKSSRSHNKVRERERLQEPPRAGRCIKLLLRPLEKNPVEGEKRQKGKKWSLSDLKGRITSIKADRRPIPNRAWPARATPDVNVICFFFSPFALQSVIQSIIVATIENRNKYKKRKGVVDVAVLGGRVPDIAMEGGSLVFSHTLRVVP